ncbi:MAG: quinolinate synthase NadA [Candidatus Heimdallarchaeota archaeon]|nr:MAG: quinolinate synthase NadA [Candidatus Heimdallarchaeota archaeon]
MSTDIGEEIISLKKDRDALLLVHNYQDSKLHELGDFSGDSFELAHKAKYTDKEMIVFAGAEFMAETAVILNPDKKVLIPSSTAKCPMAHMLSPKVMKRYQTQYPDATIAVYVNTTAEIKAMADICITSGNAIEIISKLDNDQILIGPDRNLASYIQQQLPEKMIIPFPEIGHCYVHQKFIPSDIKKLRNKYPEAEIIAHPEVASSVQTLADKICSTSGMLKEVGRSTSEKFIIMTEIGLIDRLRSNFPTKTFIPARKDAICIQQKKITIYNLYLSLLHERYQVKVPATIAKNARLSLERMLEFSEA